MLDHTRCSAIESACKNIELGHITGVLRKIKPAIELETATLTDYNPQFMEKVATNNVFLTVQAIKAQSSLLAAMESEKTINIIGGLHDIETGKMIVDE